MAERSQVRIALWITPRSLSTAFLKCMSTFENAEIFQEPYFTANIFGPERKKNIPQLEPVIESLDDVQHVTFKWVKTTLEKEYPGRDLVFMKDGARAVYGHFDSIPQGYHHVFLIRKPSKVHVSVDKIKDCVQEDYGVDKTNFTTKDPTFLPGSPHRDVLELLEYVRDELGQEPIVIDAEDLMTSPGEIMKKFCETVGLEYNESMLKWKPGPDPRWHRAESVQSLFAAMTPAHDNAYTSTGFQMHELKTETETPLSELSDDVRKMVEDSIPYYEKLAAMAIKINDD